MAISLRDGREKISSLLLKAFGRYFKKDGF